MKSTRRECSRLHTVQKAVRAVTILAVCVCLAGGKDYTILSHAQASATVKAASAKVRSGADTGSEVVAGVKKDDVLTITSEKTDSEGYTWYEVVVDDSTKGYIRADLVNKSGTVEKTAEAKEKENAAKVTETKADVTQSSYSSGTVKAKSVNVRKGPATTDAVVASVKEGTVVSITGEAKGANGKNWYQVSFLDNNKEVTGFILNDLLNASSEAAAGEGSEAEAVDGENPEEGTPEDVTQEDMQPEDLPVEEPENQTEIMKVVSSKIIPEGMKLEDMEMDAETLAGWQSGQYYMLYTKDTEGVDAWYLYDATQGITQKLDPSVFNGGAEDTEDTGLGNTGKLIVIILAALLIVMIIVCTVLFIKLRSDRWDDEDEEEDDDEEEDEEEDDGRVKRGRWKPRNFLRVDDDEDEDEDDEEEEVEPRRPVKKPVPGQAPQRRPAPARQGAAYPPQGQQQAPARRPAAGQGTPKDRNGEVIREKKPVPRQQAPAGREGAPRQTAPARREGAPRQQAPAGREGAPRQQAPAGREGAMRQTAPAGREGAMRQTAPAGREGAPRQQAPAGREGAPRQQAPAGREGAPRQQASAGREGAPRQQAPARQVAPRQQVPAGREGAPRQQTPAQPMPKQTRKYQPDIEDDDEFEFGFLNMDGKDDL